MRIWEQSEEQQAQAERDYAALLETVRIPSNDDRNHLRHVRLEGFTLRTWDTGRTCSTWQSMIGYAFYAPDAEERGEAPIFCGEDCGVAPSHAIDSDAALWGLLAFLTLRPGDTDSEYFDGYTAAQRAFAEGHAENLGLYVYEAENARDLAREHEDFVMPRFEDLDGRESEES